MPVISCWVDERTLKILERQSVITGRSVEHLAEAAIESEAIASMPDGFRNMHWSPATPIDSAERGGGAA